MNIHHYHSAAGVDKIAQYLNKQPVEILAAGYELLESIESNGLEYISERKLEKTWQKKVKELRFAGSQRFIKVKSCHLKKLILVKLLIIEKKLIRILF